MRREKYITSQYFKPLLHGILKYISIYHVLLYYVYINYVHNIVHTSCSLQYELQFTGKFNIEKIFQKEVRNYESDKILRLQIAILKK